MEKDIRVWGTRDSFPNTNVFCNEYGGDTCCVSYETAEAYYVFDAGSGLYRFGEAVKDNGKPILIFLSSITADRIMGLINFTPLSEAGRPIYIYSRTTAEFEESSALDILNRFCGRPFGVNDIDKRGASVYVGEIFSGDDIAINEDSGNIVHISVVACKNATYYSLKDNSISFAYVLDSATDEDNDDKIINFVAGHKYMFTADMDMVQLANQGLVEKIVVMQYPIDIEDKDMFEVESEAKKVSDKIIFGRGGMILQ